MSVQRLVVCFCALVFVTGCQHRSDHYKNEFELVATHDVVPEPIDRSDSLSMKDDGHGAGLSEQFSSRETVSWRTQVAYRLRPSKDSDWETSYTHSTKDYVPSKRYRENPGVFFKRTGQWPLSYRLDTGDRLRVIVYSQRTLTRAYRVDDSGYISVPLVGQVHARGSTVRAVERRISNALARKYLRDPKVSVEIATYRPFFVLGQVQSAGQYPYVVGMTAETAAAIAGGYTARANERKFRISRVYKGQRYTLMVTKNFPVFPGDTIYVQERFF